VFSRNKGGGRQSNGVSPGMSTNKRVAPKIMVVVRVGESKPEEGPERMQYSQTRYMDARPAGGWGAECGPLKRKRRRGVWIIPEKGKRPGGTGFSGPGGTDPLRSSEAQNWERLVVESGVEEKCTPDNSGVHHKVENANKTITFGKS